MINGIQRTLIKNGKLHKEGETNVRASRQACPVCEERINAGEGYKIINDGTFFYVHDTCKSHYNKNKASDKEYKHGLWFILKIQVVAPKVPHYSFKDTAYTVKHNGIRWDLAISTQTRNNIKSLQLFDGLTMNCNIQVVDSKTGQQSNHECKVTSYLELSNLLAELSYNDLNTFIGTWDER